MSKFFKIFYRALSAGGMPTFSRFHFDGARQPTGGPPGCPGLGIGFLSASRRDIQP